MLLHTSLSIVLFAVLSVSAQNYDATCPCTLSSLWLDVAVVIDNSPGMTAPGLTQIAADVASVFGQSSITQTPGQTTRIALITYNDYATTNYNLTQINSTDDFISAVFDIAQAGVKGKESVLKNGLAAGLDALEKGRANNNRDNVKQVLIIYASDYSDVGNLNPNQLANQTKEAGINIFTVAFDQGGSQSLLAGLNKIATTGFSYSNKQPTLVEAIQQGLCNVNCFCPQGWSRYEVGTGYQATLYAACVRPADIDATWTPAKFSCQNLYTGGGSYLANIYGQKKQAFVDSVVFNDPTITEPLAYHIGLSWNVANSAWMWEQPKGMPQTYLSNNTYTNWGPGNPPSPPGSNTCVTSTQMDLTNKTTVWIAGNCYSVSKRYVCEVIGCSTDTYCATVV